MQNTKKIFQKTLCISGMTASAGFISLRKSILPGSEINGVLLLGERGAIGPVKFLAVDIADVGVFRLHRRLFIGAVRFRHGHGRFRAVGKFNIPTVTAANNGAQLIGAVDRGPDVPQTTQNLFGGMAIFIR